MEIIAIHYFHHFQQYILNYLPIQCQIIFNDIRCRNNRFLVKIHSEKNLSTLPFTSVPCRFEFNNSFFHLQMKFSVENSFWSFSGPPTNQIITIRIVKSNIMIHRWDLRFEKYMKKSNELVNNDRKNASVLVLSSGNLHQNHEIFKNFDFIIFSISIPFSTT